MDKKAPTLLTAARKMLKSIGFKWERGNAYISAAGAREMNAAMDELAAAIKAQQTDQSDGRYTWTVEIKVPPQWVADGLEITDDSLFDMLSTHYGWIPAGAVAGRVLSAPDPRQVRAEQGYKEPGYTALLDE